MMEISRADKVDQSLDLVIGVEFNGLGLTIMGPHPDLGHLFGLVNLDFLGVKIDLPNHLPRMSLLPTSQGDPLTLKGNVLWFGRRFILLIWTIF